MTFASRTLSSRRLIDEAVKGSYELALKALMAHRLVRTYTKAKAILDDLPEADKEYLPPNSLKKQSILGVSIS